MITISTIGDSLTEGSARQSAVGEAMELPWTYQYWAWRALDARGIRATIRNRGIGGETANQIAARIQETLPADVVAVMGGTNDCWRYADMAPDDPDFVEELVDDVVSTLSGAYDAVLAAGTRALVICAVPCVGNRPSLPRNMAEAIRRINTRLQATAESLGAYFCDLHAGMRGPNGWMDPANDIGDGVHFSIAGNRACGETVAATLVRVASDLGLA
jgi:lysophospholipase L1-like esterase